MRRAPLLSEGELELQLKQMGGRIKVSLSDSCWQKLLQLLCLTKNCFCGTERARRKGACRAASEVGDFLHTGQRLRSCPGLCFSVPRKSSAVAGNGTGSHQQPPDDNGQKWRELSAKEGGLGLGPGFSTYRLSLANLHQAGSFNANSTASYTKELVR